MKTKDKKPSRSKYKPYTQKDLDRHEEKHRKHFRKKAKITAKDRKALGACEHDNVSYKALLRLINAQESRSILDEKLHKTNHTVIWNLRHAVDVAENNNIFLKSQIVNAEKYRGNNKELPNKLIKKIQDLQREINFLKGDLDASKENKVVRKVMDKVLIKLNKKEKGETNSKKNTEDKVFKEVKTNAKNTN